MKRKTSYVEKLEELAREYELPLRGEALVQSRLRWEDWETLRQEVVGFAKEQVRLRRWRGKRGGVLPGGQGGEDVADEAIRSLLGGNCRLVPGFIREKVVNELKRLVRQKVRVLHGLREAAAMRSEWEVAPPNELGEPVSVLEEVMNETSATPDEAEAREEWKERILGYLEGEPELKSVFECLWIGVRKPEQIARRLEMDEHEVVRARKRLDRRLRTFAKSKQLRGGWNGEFEP